MIDIVASVVSTIGIDAVKGYFTDKYDTKKLKDEIHGFARREFESRYKHLSLSDEIDFGGLLSRISTDYIGEIRVCLFDLDVSVRKRCLESITERTYSYTAATNDAQKSEIKRFIETSINIARQYFVGKLDGKYKLLNNITVDTILNSLSCLRDKINEELNDVKTQIIDVVRKEMFDEQPVVELINDMIGKGDFKGVKAILEAMNHKSIALISYTKLKMSCFVDGYDKTKHLHDFMQSNPSDYLTNDLTAFLCLHDKEQNCLCLVSEKCTDDAVKAISTLLLEQRINELCEEECVDDVIQFKVVPVYAGSELAHKLLSLYILENKPILNRQDIYKVLDGGDYNFHHVFLSLSYQAHDLMSKEGIEYNSKFKHELNQVYDKLIFLESSFNDCSEKYRIEYYVLILTITEYLSYENLGSILENLPSDLKDIPCIKKYAISYAIFYERSYSHDEVVDFYVRNSKYVCLHTYLKHNANNPLQILKFFDEYKFLLKNSVELLDLYLSCIVEINGIDCAIPQISCYFEHHSKSLAFHFICLEFGYENTDQGVTVSDFLSRLEDNVFPIVLLGRVSNYLLKVGKSEETIRIFSNAQYFNWSYKLHYAELIFMYKKDTMADEAKKIVNSMISCGYEHHKIFELRASIDLAQGREIDALKDFYSSYQLNSDNLTSLNYILVLSYHNQRDVGDEILTAAGRIDDVNIQHVVAMLYLRSGDVNNYAFHIKKCLLLCKDTVPHIFVTFASNNAKHHGKDDPITLDRVNSNTAVFVKNVETNDVKVYCIHENKRVLPKNGTSFGDAVHCNVQDMIGITLFRKQVDDLVNIEGADCTVIEIMSVDAYLAKYCWGKLVLIDDRKVMWSIKTDLDAENPFEDLIKTLSSFEESNQKIINLYAKPDKVPPIPISSLAEISGRSYRDTFLHLLHNPQIVFWSNPFSRALRDSDKILLSYGAVLTLNSLDVNSTLLRKQTNLYVANSTKNKALSEYNDNYTYLNRDSVMTVTSKDNQLIPFVYSDDEKTLSIGFDVKTVSLLDALTPIENEKDLDCAWLKDGESRKLIGVFEYDTIAMFANESEDSVIITEDSCIANIVLSAHEINSTPCGVLDLLIYLDIGVELFIEILQKIKAFNFSIPLTIAAIEYLTRGMKDVDDEVKLNAFFEKLDDFFELPDDSTYCTYFINNVMFLYWAIGHLQNTNPVLINKYLDTKLFNLCAQHIYKFSNTSELFRAEDGLFCDEPPYNTKQNKN